MHYRYPLLKPILLCTGALFLIAVMGLYIYFGTGQQEKSLEMSVVSVLADGNTYSIRTHGDTVGDVLRQQHIELAADDLLQPQADTPLHNRMTIRITRVAHQKTAALQSVPYETVYYQDASLDQGQQQIIQTGQNGTIRIIGLAGRNDGMTVSERIIDQQMIQPYTAQVIAIGTRLPAKNKPIIPMQTDTPANPADQVDQVDQANPVEQERSRSDRSESSVSTVHLQALSGEGNYPVNPVKSYRYELAAELTAYTAGVESTGKQPGDSGYGVTASGAMVKEGQTVSVDPTVIPMGWWMYIEGVGYRKAEDTGSAIKGSKIDIYMDKLDAARSFGRKSGIKVYVIGPDKPDV
ncbi:G5 and 3D domain-containing protein [Paenibacillus shenyangensis]|uniref:G5 and 3D domain-containing protein n=1 Tax=Paenibacillus sp. A9 TaxID=1284352 RepID=UPI0003787649|nr:3D domain-containing protein [Paenibacillus sp. A9]